MNQRISTDALAHLIVAIEKMIEDEQFEMLRHYTNAACQYINEYPEHAITWLRVTYSYSHVPELDWHMNLTLAECNWAGSKIIFKGLTSNK